MKKAFSLMIAACLAVSLLAGCGSSTPAPAADNGSNAPQQEAPAAKKVMIIGDTTFNSENWEETVDPHRTYNGWACIRYGIGETRLCFLFLPANEHDFQDQCDGLYRPRL